MLKNHQATSMSIIKVRIPILNVGCGLKLTKPFFIMIVTFHKLLNKLSFIEKKMILTFQNHF